jgi:hypothetical protein
VAQSPTSPGNKPHRYLTQAKALAEIRVRQFQAIQFIWDRIKRSRVIGSLYPADGDSPRSPGNACVSHGKFYPENIMLIEATKVNSIYYTYKMHICQQKSNINDYII